MEVRFQTKKESKQQQQQVFLNLSGEERFMKFLDLSRTINRLPVKTRNSFEHRYKGNFLLTEKDKKK